MSPTAPATVKPAAPKSVESTVAPESTVPALTPVEAFRAACDAVNAGDVRGDAGVTLKALTLDRYRHAALKLSKNVNGFRILSSSDRKRASLSVWEDAGCGDVPKTENRTPADKSIASYVSSFGTVASDFAWGLDGLADVETVSAAYASIRDNSSAIKADAAHRAYIAWKNSIPRAEAEALSLAFDVLTRTSGHGGKEHAAEFAKIIRDANADQ